MHYLQLDRILMPNAAKEGKLNQNLLNISSQIISKYIQLVAKFTLYNLRNVFKFEASSTLPLCAGAHSKCVETSDAIARYASAQKSRAPSGAFEKRGNSRRRFLPRCISRQWCRCQRKK
jgi:hypothetical protein